MKQFLPALLSSAILAIGSASASDAGGLAKINTPPVPVVTADPHVADSRGNIGVQKQSPQAAIDAQAAAPQPQNPNAVQVPETVGVSVLAGVAFLFMFGRRRYA